ncbi:MAG: undecaprenyl-diphosphate phosphatase [Puniceicoccales bacterium]|jgi:undecaprenyl-diphosphatase|nr:undecaprenyl-diphosphate phosphatase [Puniceicoccales bacterium]
MKRLILQILSAIIIVLISIFLPSTEIKNEFLDKYATTLGIIQGATEFLPISSTAHMVIFEQFIAAKHSGQKQDVIHQENPVHEFGTIIQLGSVLAMIFLYFSRIKLILSGIFLFNKEGLQLLLKLILGLMPCAVIGLMINDFLKKFCKPQCLAIALATGAFVMLFGEKFYKKSKKIDNFDAISYKTAFSIGLCQCFAFIPGVSRSMTTIVGGYLSNLSRSVSIEFSFLLGTATMGLAALYKLVFSQINAIIAPFYSIKGTLVAFLTSLLMMKLSIYILKKYGLYLFAIYRILLAMAIIFLVNFY